MRRDDSFLTGVQFYKTGFEFLFCCCLTCIDIISFGKWTKWFLISRLTECFLNYDIPIRIVPIVGRTRTVSSNTFPAIKNLRSTCFLIETRLSLAICTLKFGGGSSLKRASGCACRIFLDSASERALWMAPVSKTPWFSFWSICKETYHILCFLFICKERLGTFKVLAMTRLNMIYSNLVCRVSPSV